MPTKSEIACHEAGHVVADHRFGFGVAGVTIEKTGYTLGAARSIDGPSMFGHEDHLAVISLLAGWAAVVIRDGVSTKEAEGGAHSDFERAEDLLLRIGDQLTDEWRSQALSFVAGESAAIERLAKELCEWEFLSGDEVSLIIGTADGAAEAEAGLAEWRDNFRALYEEQRRAARVPQTKK